MRYENGELMKNTRCFLFHVKYLNKLQRRVNQSWFTTGPLKIVFNWRIKKERKNERRNKYEELFCVEYLSHIMILAEIYSFFFQF